MKKTILILLVINCLSTFGQKDPKNLISPVDVFYGYRTYSQTFYDQLNTVSNFSTNKPLQIIGLGGGGAVAINRDWNGYGHSIYNHILPQTIFIQDTLKGKITGFSFGFALGGAFETKKQNAALGYYAGFNTGRLKIIDNNYAEQKNPFFSPKVGIHPKIKIWKFALSLILEYEYDLSKTSWRQTSKANDNQTKINSLRQSGLIGQIGLGYILTNNYR
jgi:hypothetical protein